jgi:hypothetical protein
MLSKFQFAPNVAAMYTTTVVFDIGEAPAGGTGKLNITNLNFEYGRSNERRPKMELVGSWPGFNKINELLVHVDFDISGNDTTDFNLQKRRLTHAFSPADPFATLVLQELGTLTMRFDGDTEDMSAVVTLDGDVTIPYVGPAYSNAQLTFVIAQGYCIGVTSGNFYYPK